jgi:hypothetical protein
MSGNLRGENNYHWKGGRVSDNDGYVLLYRPDHPRAGSTGYVFEHVLVAEQSYGEPIPRGLHVHHLNGIRDDNRLANLVVVEPKDHERNTVRRKLQERVRFLEAELARHGIEV